MLSTFSRPELRESTANGRIFLNEAMKKMSEYTHQAHEMMQRVRNTRNDYDKLLQMVQRQAQIDEVRLSRLHADLASAQSRSVMIFTTFTVIFLPLTFFTGLFGMNTQEWGGENNLSLRTIGLISLPASLVLVAASLIAAWSTNARRLMKATVRVCNSATERLREMVYDPLVDMMIPRRSPTQGQREERETRGRRTGIVQEVSDFWERHRLERERGYAVPEKNKAKGERGRGSWRSKVTR